MIGWFFLAWPLLVFPLACYLDACPDNLGTAHKWKPLTFD